MQGEWNGTLKLRRSALRRVRHYFPVIANTAIANTATQEHQEQTGIFQPLGPAGAYTVAVGFSLNKRQSHHWLEEAELTEETEKS